MWTDVHYTRSPRCWPCSPHSLYYLYTAWHQFRNALYWFCIANPSGDPFSFASWRVWAGRANTQTHLVQSVSVSDLLHTYKEQHTHTDTGQYVHCEKMYNMYMQTTLKKQEFPYTYIYKGSSFSTHFLQCIPCVSQAQSTSHQDSRTWLTRTLIRILIPNAPAKKAFVISYLRPRCVRGEWARSTSWNQHK